MTLKFLFAFSGDDFRIIVKLFTTQITTDFCNHEDEVFEDDSRRNAGIRVACSLGLPWKFVTDISESGVDNLSVCESLQITGDLVVGIDVVIEYIDLLLVFSRHWSKLFILFV